MGSLRNLRSQDKITDDPSEPLHESELVSEVSCEEVIRKLKALRNIIDLSHTITFTDLLDD